MFEIKVKKNVKRFVLRLNKERQKQFKEFFILFKENYLSF
jgi:hypothetical protein